MLTICHHEVISLRDASFHRHRHLDFITAYKYYNIPLQTLRSRT